LAVLGVTGTNGKTTVTWMVRSILRAAGRGCGLIGTTGYDVGSGMEQALWTTPGAVELSRLLGAARGSGLEAVAMECSSHALDQKRTAGIRFVGAAFTNLTGDHLDYHVTLGAYLDAKALLFEGLGAGSTAVLNVHDVASAELARRTRARVMRFGIGVDCEVAAEITRLDVRGTGFVLRLDGEEVLVECPLVGRHNVMNCLAAAGLAYGAGVGCDDIAAGLSGLEQVPGRLERVSGVSRPVVFVDYAHTDDGLEQVCGALRSLTGGRLVVVFGCGGDRDRTKRPRMARVAEKWADCIVVTDDNPRSESPGAIRGEVLAGFSAAGREKAVEIGDRGKAIRHAIATAGEDDVVLIAGKGHENYQIVGERVVEFDDRVVSRACLAEYGGGSVRASRMETT
jgi:UDP-N-acetylmuramoyl-L-alanyl-D-glutamate--2,6-diaminopimelate ligase